MPTEMPRAAVLDALAAGATVVTGNARLARSLATDYDRRLLASGATAWPTPAVLPLPAWLLATWEEASLRAPNPLPRVLAAEQEEQVWAAIIHDERAGNPGVGAVAPLRLDATARRARQSWERVCEFQLDLADGRFGLTENPEAFRRWAQRFVARSRERAELPAADLPARLLPKLAEGWLPLPPQLLLAGFYELTPTQQALVAALRAAGCAADWIALSGEPGVAARVRADDLRHEVGLAAAWARGLLERRPQLRLGIVVPDLGARRAALAQALRRTLDPASLLPGAGPAPRPWNFSLGQPLATYPVVATALRLLGLMQSPADTEALGLLLLSPHWALPDDISKRRAELERRALLDRRIRRLGDARLQLSTLLFHAGGAGAPERAGDSARPWHSPRLAQRLDALQLQARELPGRGDAGDWARHFSAWLKAADWGAWGRGGRPLDSHEYQAVEAWGDLLSRFSSLSDFAGSLSLAGALTLIGRLATETLFQPRAGDASVQVLGLHEAIGQSFDRLWVMGLHDGVWPPAPAPDPFLPIGLQRERGLPHSGPELDLDWAAGVTAQLRQAAPEVVFSWPARDGDQQLQCSPLIAALPERAAKDLTHGDEPGWQRRVADSAAPEAAPAPEPVPLREARVHGGSRVFADQAACPFRAFANHRLGAAPLERPQAGLDAKRRGTLTHRLLARLWADLGTQANLLALDDEALRTKLRLHIDELLETERLRSPATFTARFRSLEARRLEEQSLRWLELERARSAFKVVAQEEERRFETGGVAVRLFVDRIDELPDGAQVVLDYKTGMVRPSAWFGARPEEPQLPLYGVAVRDGADENPAKQHGPVAAVAFAQIRADGVGFSGVVREAGLLPELPATRNRLLRDATAEWPAVLDAWAGELERLATGFGAGTAEVDPKRGLRTCDAVWCELQPLCRVRESLAPSASADQNSDDNGDEEVGDGD